MRFFYLIIILIFSVSLNIYQLKNNSIESISFTYKTYTKLKAKRIILEKNRTIIEDAEIDLKNFYNFNKSEKSAFNSVLIGLSQENLILGHNFVLKDLFLSIKINFVEKNISPYIFYKYDY